MTDDRKDKWTRKEPPWSLYPKPPGTVLKYPYLGLETEEERKSHFWGIGRESDAYEETVFDPNRHYVKKQIGTVIRHLKDNGVAHDTILNEMADEMLRFLVADEEKPLDLEMLAAGAVNILPAVEKLNRALGEYAATLDDAGVPLPSEDAA